MITALYAWVRYEAKRSNIEVNPLEFNTWVEKLVENQATTNELNLLYEPIKHLFEENIEERADYQFEIRTSKGNKRKIYAEEMKYIMLPKRGLTGKARQAIGGSIFSRSIKNYVEEVYGEYEEEKKGTRIIRRVCIIPESNLEKFWHKRLLDTYFQSAEELIGEEKVCSFCGITHKFKNLRFNPPINIYVENVTNYNSYLSNEPSHSICPYCSMLFLRTVVEEKGPMKVFFPKTKKAWVYLLPYDPENEEIYRNIEREKAEEFLKEELQVKGFTGDALKYLLSLPLFIYQKFLPISYTGKFKPSVYVVFAQHSGQAEEVQDSFVITRFDYLGKVGEKLYQKENRALEIMNFQRRLQSFTEKFKGDQIVNGYKLIFRFLAKLLGEGEADFTFLHSILRKEITQKKGGRKEERIFLGGFGYLKAFLEAEKEVKNG